MEISSRPTILVWKYLFYPHFRSSSKTNIPTLWPADSFFATPCLNLTSTGGFPNSEYEPFPDADTFNRFLPWFLEDIPTQDCAKGGHPAYGQGLVLNGLGSNLTVGANHFMSYHTILKTSVDFYSALEQARVIADNISQTLSNEDRHVEVFPYSIFYVFYEQYLTMWKDVLNSLVISVAAIFVVTFILLGLDFHSALIILITITMIIIDMIGIMYWWNISLNAVSLVNLVMAVGISVEFCSHMVRAFAVSVKPSRLSRAREALLKMGPSVSVEDQ